MASATTVPSMGRSSRPTLGIVAAFAAVYTIWGSTYFAIAIAITALPPFLMAGARFLIAGGLVFAWMRLRGTKWPSLAEWGAAVVIGALMLVAGNGGVVFAEQYVPSGLASLVVAMVPIYIALLDWLRPGGKRPTALVTVGLIFGFAGIFLLIGPDALGGGASYFPWILIPLFGSLAWAAGSLYSRSARLPAAPLMGTALEMLAGGVILVALSFATGEETRINPDQFSVEAALAFAFLVVFGSIVAFSAYIWLLRTVSPARVSTYAYVNPVVALFLGSTFHGEQITPRTLIAAAVILVAVAIITGAQAGKPKPQPTEQPRAQAGNANVAPEAPPALPESIPASALSSPVTAADSPAQREHSAAR